VSLWFFGHGMDLVFFGTFATYCGFCCGLLMGKKHMDASKRYETGGMASRLSHHKFSGQQRIHGQMMTRKKNGLKNVLKTRSQKR